jgi:CAAX prenyl protease-like protein
VGLDGWYPSVESALKGLLSPILRPLGFAAWCSAPPTPVVPWNPHAHFSAPLAWGFALVRLVGSTIVVPPLEEVFYRSFLYRYITRTDFQAMPMSCFSWTPFLVTAAVFGFAHYEWLPGILCGMVFQGLVLRHSRLGDAMTAHAITNFLLGLWVIWMGAWHFW